MLNPVFRRELTTVLRTWKTYGAVTAYSLMMLAVCGIYAYSFEKNSEIWGFQPRDILGIYIVVALLQVGLILIISPALTSGAISLERERQTLDLMLITKMSALSIVLGKLVSSLFVVMLMIVSSLPVFAVIFYYGGVSVANLGMLVIFTIILAGFIGSFSIMYSSLFKKTLASTVVSYLTIIAFCIITFIIVFTGYILTNSYYWYENTAALFWGYSINTNLVLNTLVLALNPIMAFISIIDGQIGRDICWGLVHDLSHIHTFNYPKFPFWIITLILYSVLSVFFLTITVKQLNPVKENKKQK